MKKKYEKPMLYIEDFEISQHIAGGCSVTDGANHYKDSCSITDADWGMALFTLDIDSCELTPDLTDCQDAAAASMGYFFS